MPDRIVRDELLTSERYWSVSIEAQRLFVHLILVVDNLSRFSGKNYTIRATCFPGQPIEPEKLERMLAELHDVDLIRMYVVDAERYLFLPRSGQRLRYRTSKFPSPPNEINDIPEEKTDCGQSVVGLQSDRSQTVVARSEVKRSEVKRREALLGASRFVPPTLEQLKAYVSDRRLNVNAEAFLDHFQSNGWKVGGKTPMKDWQAAARTWSSRNNERQPQSTHISYECEK
jgi:hypothetical protein